MRVKQDRFPTKKPPSRSSYSACRSSMWLVTQKCSQTRRLILTLFTGSHRLREQINI